MGFRDSLFSSSKYYVPYGKTPKERAQELLETAKYHADELNKSTTVFDFSYSYEKLEKIIDELIWLNEKKKVFMYPTPRSNWDEIQENLGAEINKFIERAVENIPKSKANRLDDINALFDEIKNDQVLSEIMLPENQEKISSILLSEKNKENRKIENVLLSSVGINGNLDLSEINPMRVVEALENNISQLYKYFYTKELSAKLGEKLLSNFEAACNSSKLPLMANIRLESLLEYYRPKFQAENPMLLVDQMEGHDFEYWCAELLKKNGFINIVVTPGSRDQGVDITAEKSGIHYAIQCKCYSSDLGNKPVQEVYAGKEMYRCQVGVVMTNRYFTSGAKALAEQTRILLWDRDKLQEMIECAKLTE